MINVDALLSVTQFVTDFLSHPFVVAHTMAFAFGIYAAVLMFVDPCRANMSQLAEDMLWHTGKGWAIFAYLYLLVMCPGLEEMKVETGVVGYTIGKSVLLAVTGFITAVVGAVCTALVVFTVVTPRLMSEWRADEASRRI